MIGKSLLVAQREYSENLRTKTFWIGILAFPVLLLVVILVPMWLDKQKDARRYAVLDRSGWLDKAVVERATAPDMERVLRKAIDEFRENKAVSALFPEAVRDQIEAFVDNEEQLEVIARFFARAAGWEPGDAGTIPAKAKAAIESGAEQIRQWWKDLPPDEARKLAPDLSKARYVRVEIDTEVVEDPEALLAGKLESGELFAYFVVNDDPIESDEGCKYVSKNLTDNNLRRWYERHANVAVRKARLVREKISERVVELVTRDFSFRSKRKTKTGAEEEVEDADRLSQFAPVIFVYLLWIAIFMVGQMLLTNTIEEKSSRIIEVLLSSVSARQLMTGKILGLASVGLTMVGSWVVFFIVTIKTLPFFLERMPEIDFSVILSNPTYLSSFLVYFFLGYLLFAAAFVGMGSVCNTLKEAQNLMMPLFLVLVIPLLAMIPIGQDPNGRLAKLLSYIPPFTPFVMMNRAAGPPSTLEYVLTTILLVISIILACWGAAKVFRVGILMTGKPPKIVDIVRMIFR